MANFTTAMTPWRMRDFGKITCPMEKDAHMILQAELISFSLYKELALF